NSPDTFFSISPLRMNSYKAISFNTRFQANQNGPSGDPDVINYVKLPSFGSNFTGSNFTVEFWCKYNQTPGNWSRFFDFTNTINTASGILLSPSATSTNSIDGHSFNSTNPVGTLLTPTNLTTNFSVGTTNRDLGYSPPGFVRPFSWLDWHHVALVLDSTTILKIYVDGLLQGRFTGQAQPNANLVLNYIARSTFGMDASSNLQMQDFRLWQTARTQQQIADNFSRNIATLTAPQRVNLYYWMPLTPQNQEKRTSYNISATQAKNSTGYNIPASTFASSNSSGAVFYGAPASSSNNPQFTYDSNKTFTNTTQLTHIDTPLLNAGKRFYISHRSLLVGERVLYRITNSFGSQTNWAQVSNFQNRPNDKIVDIPASLNFYAGIIETCISANGSTNTCNGTEPQTLDSIQTVPDAPIITNISGRNKNITISFTISDSGFTSLTNTQITAVHQATNASTSFTINPVLRSYTFNNLDSGNYIFWLTANNKIGGSDTTYSNSFKVSDTTLVRSVVFCEDSMYFTIQPRDTNVYYTIYFTQLNGSGAALTPIAGNLPLTRRISKSYTDTTIRYKFPTNAVGNKYQVFFRFQRRTDTTINNVFPYTYYTTASYVTNTIDTIRYTSTANIDSLCSGITNKTLTINAKGGGQSQDSNYAGGSANYSYRWYTNSINSTSGGTFLNIPSAYTANLTVPTSTLGITYYYLLIGDTISGNNTCGNYKHTSNILGVMNTYKQPDTAQLTNFGVGDTVCFLGNNSFKTITFRDSVTSGPAQLSTVWYRSNTLNGIYTALNTNTALVGNSFLLSNFTPSKDSANLRFDNFIYAVAFNGPQRLNCAVQTAKTQVYYLLDSNTRPSVSSPQNFVYLVNDTVGNLVPPPSATNQWYLTNSSTTGLTTNYRLSPSTYYVANITTTYNISCPSVRVPVTVGIFGAPSQPDSVSVILTNNASNQTIARVFLPRGERFPNSPFDSPTRYTLFVTTLNTSGAARTIILDSFIRNTSKFDSFINNTLGTYVNLSSARLLNKERFRFFVRATNTTGSRTSNASRTVNGDTVWAISPLLLNSFRSTNWNSRSNTAAVLNTFTPAPAPANYIQLPNPLNLSNTNYTIEMWAKFTTNTPSDWTSFFNLSSVLAMNSDILFGLPGAPSNKFTFRSNANETANGTVASYGNLFGGILNLTDWHHYAITLNGTSSVTTNAVQRLYIDGVLVATQSNQRWLATNPTFNYIGKTTYSTLPVTNYQVQDFRIW
ncbi:MAG: hypothetical protein ORN85_07170, partial [Sediminibacterium sp.]|nr:hypothetical protein [Sediminibacterium sp.]